MALKVLQFFTKRQWLGLIAFILLVIVATGFVDEFLSGPQVKPFLLSSGSFVQTIVASGHVESPNRISISAQITGTVADVPVMEGQDVVKGQLLIQLENTELQAALRQAQASEQLALSNLRQLREVKTPIAIQTHVQAEVNFGTAKKNLERILALYAQGFVVATESGYPKFIAESWYGIWAPKGTPDDRIQFLNKAANEAVRQLTKSGAFEQLGIEPVVESIDEFKKYTSKYIAENAELLKGAGFKPE